MDARDKAKIRLGAIRDSLARAGAMHGELSKEQVSTSGGHAMAQSLRQVIAGLLPAVERDHPDDLDKQAAGKYYLKQALAVIERALTQTEQRGTEIQGALKHSAKNMQALEAQAAQAAQKVESGASKAVQGGQLKAVEGGG